VVQACLAAIEDVSRYANAEKLSACLRRFAWRSTLTRRPSQRKSETRRRQWSRSCSEKKRRRR